MSQNLSSAAVVIGALRVKIQTYPISMSFNKSCFAKYVIENWNLISFSVQDFDV